jgi:uncharacterized membrane-anchored protein
MPEWQSLFHRLLKQKDSMKHGLIKAFFAVLFLACTGVGAQIISKEEAAQVWTDAMAASFEGPIQVPLGGQATLNLPEGQVFIPQPHANRVMRVMGNPGTDDRLQGLVFPKDQAPWFMTIRFENSGYVKDDDAKDWNADELLASYKEGTETANEEREKMGVAGLEILGWAEKPVYDATTHRLAWAMSSKEKGVPDTHTINVNYNTYALGRDGYFSMNLVTELKDLPVYKPTADLLLNSLEFNAGKRYADFNANTDKVAEYGIAALIIGAAAKKLGWAAALIAWLAQPLKLAVLAAIALGAILVRWFRKKPQNTPTAADSIHVGDSTLKNELDPETIFVPYHANDHFQATVLVADPDHPTEPAPLDAAASAAAPLAGADDTPASAPSTSTNTPPTPPTPSTPA